MKKLSLILIASFLVATQTYAATGTTSTGTNLITDLNRLLGQYESQLKYLQAENSVLRNEISKAGIKIPLSEFPSSVSTETPATVTGSTTTTGNTETTTRSVSGEFEVALGNIETTHGKRYRGFIAGITPNWSAIKNAYKLPADASILGYEFVKK